MTMIPYSFLLLFSFHSLAQSNEDLHCILATKSKEKLFPSQAGQSIKEWKVKDIPKEGLRGYSFFKKKIRFKLEKGQYKIVFIDTLTGEKKISLFKREVSFIEMKVGDSELRCQDDKVFQKTPKISKSKFLKSSIHLADLLSSFGKYIKFKNILALNFQYYQSTSSDKMRALFFHGGKVLTEDLHNQLANTDDWCSYQIRINLDENINIKKGISLKGLDYKEQSYNKEYKVYSYSFIDLDSGKKVYETYKYSAFSFTCRVKKKKAFTLSLFKEIVGNHFVIETY